MESLLVWLSDLGPHAPLLIFLLLVVTGFSVPVSEDLIVLVSGVLASTVLPEYTVALFLAAFFGSYISDCIAYGLGRMLGDKIYQLKAAEQMQKVSAFYKKYGVWTLVVGRCIPFGLRNAIFMMAGAGKMHFRSFLISDGIACAGFSSLLFFLAYSCGKNHETLVISIQQTSFVIGVIAIAFLAAAAIYLLAKRKKARQAVNQLLP